MYALPCASEAHWPIGKIERTIEAFRRKQELASEVAGLASNEAKLEIFSFEGNLDAANDFKVTLKKTRRSLKKRLTEGAEIRFYQLLKRAGKVTKQYSSKTPLKRGTKLLRQEMTTKATMTTFLTQ